MEMTRFMVVTYPNHTIQINDYPLMGQQVTSDIPYVQRRTGDLKIQGGPTATYFLGQDLRTFTFTAKPKIKTTRLELLDELTQLVNKNVTVTSIYLGSFTALAVFKEVFTDSEADVVTTNWTIKEVA